MDEHPVPMKPAVPCCHAYNLESLIAMMVVHQHESHTWLQRLTDQFDRLYQKAPPARVLSGVHPYIMGAPHRIRHFGVRLHAQ
jgi:hypothetical protein